ncbi:MAG: MBL fold metallo-hydrolase [Bacteroidota bacterium]
MIKIRNFVFNTFMVNTYLLYNESGESILVDAACYEESEEKELAGFILDNGLKVVRNLNTHCHIDHILGNPFIAKRYGISPEFHRASLPFLGPAREIGLSFGYEVNSLPEPKGFLEDGTLIPFGKSTLKVLYTPGHADGSVCFYCEQEGFVITGDVLFKDTIGRTDLPTGDLDLLMESIHTKLFSLPDNTVVYPGHGPETTIGYEKMNNPFIR